MSGHTMVLRAWPRRPGVSVALVFAAIETFRSPEELDAHVILLDRSATAVKALATGSLVPMVPTNPGWELDSPLFELDFAAYEIRSGEFAFGVRFEHTTQFAAGENTTEVLHLFRQDCGSLIDILHTEVRMVDVQRGPNDLTESTSFVIIAPETTRGFHDIIVRRRSITGSLDPSEPSRPDRKTERSERWRWTGERYEPSE
jgi:hypothetical protein